MAARRTRAGGTRKRPVRYRATAADAELAAGLRAHRRQAWEEAAALYRRVLARDPACLDSIINLGSVLVSLGRAREAEQAFARALELDGVEPRALRDAGIGLASLGRWELARRHLERAVVADPSLIGAALHLTRVCAEMGDRGAALERARATVARAPGDAAARREMHRVLFDDAEPVLGIEAALAAVELDPSWDLARLELAGSLELAGRPGTAAQVLGGLRGSAGLRDALAYAFRERSARTRFLSESREALLFALDAASLDGPVLELGVRHGTSTRILARRFEGEVHAFDSFRGLPEPWYGREAGAFTTDGELPDVPANVVLHVGLFAETLPRFVDAHPAPPRLIHIDSDLYSSARLALDALAPLVRPGTVLVFDEYIGNDGWRQDEHRAFQEVRAARSWRYEYLAFSWFTGQAVVRIG